MAPSAPPAPAPVQPAPAEAPVAASPNEPAAAASPGDIAEHPLVKQTIELLGARVVSVQPRVKKE